MCIFKSVDSSNLFLKEAMPIYSPISLEEETISPCPPGISLDLDWDGLSLGQELNLSQKKME